MTGTPLSRIIATTDSRSSAISSAPIAGTCSIRRRRASSRSVRSIRTDALLGYLKQIEKRYVLGSDPFNIEDLWMRMYRNEAAATPFFTVYVGYYPSQAEGRTIHSPRNCLPGGGWEALSFAEEPVQTARGPIVVARYLIRRGDEQALVLYWYQGRGRVESGEYAVKYQLLRDAALRGRSEEALVRVMVPVTAGVESSAGLAREVAAIVAPALFGALPE